VARSPNTPAVPRISRRFFGAGLFVYLALTLIAGWVFLFWHIRVDRDRTVQSARHQLTTISTAIAYNFDAMIHDGVGAANAGANQINIEELRKPLTAAEGAQVLGRMLTGGQYVRELFVVSADTYFGARRSPAGEVITFVESIPNGFQSMQTTRAHTWVGAPRVGADDSWSQVPVARRIDGGSTALWAGTVLSSETFRNLSETLSAERGGVSLVSYDGTVLMRAPSDELHYVGRSVASSEVFQRASQDPSETVVMETNHPFTGRARMVVSHRLREYPIFSSAGTDVDTVLSPWRDRAAVSIKSAAASSIGLAILTTALYVLMRRRFEALLRSEERFQLAVQGTSDGIWDWSIQEGVVYYSARLLELLGLQELPLEATPDAFWQRVHPDDLPDVKQHLAEHLESGIPYDVQARLLCHPGVYRWFRCRGAAVRDRSGLPTRMAGSISDIHEKRLAEQSLEEAQARELNAQRNFSGQLMVTQEDQRQRLANELHDGIGQNLSIIKNRAVLSLQSEHLPLGARETLEQLSAIATTTIAELRAVTRNLLPVQVQQLGLTEALQALTEQFQAAHAIRLNSRIEQVDDVLRGEDAMHVFRMVQEMLSNIGKHSAATTCHLRVERDIRTVRIDVQDNGTGFDTAQFSQRGLGLASMEHRARILGASIRVNSAIGRGTQIVVEIPIEECATADREHSSLADRERAR
jgi:PAS domain S-box-containing protein